jgi:hypothetical protein
VHQPRRVEVTPTGVVYPNQDLGPARHKTQTLSLVVATEVACVDAKSQADCFNANTALTWTLFTSLPIDQADDCNVLSDSTLGAGASNDCTSP